MNHRNCECCSFPWTGFRLDNDTFLFKDKGYDSLLDISGFTPIEIWYCLKLCLPPQSIITLMSRWSMFIKWNSSIIFFRRGPCDLVPQTLSHPLRDLQFSSSFSSGLITGLNGERPDRPCSYSLDKPVLRKKGEWKPSLVYMVKVRTFCGSDPHFYQLKEREIKGTLSS